MKHVWLRVYGGEHQDQLEHLQDMWVNPRYVGWFGKSWHDGCTQFHLEGWSAALTVKIRPDVFAELMRNGQV